MTEPTDAEIFVVAREAGLLPDNSHPAPETRAARKHSNAVQAFARAVLAKWGTPPAVAGEPVAFLVCTEEGDPDMVFLNRHEAQQYLEDHEQPIPLYTTQQPTQAQAGAVPLTPEAINAMAREYPAEDLCGWSYRMGIADAEQHHGIKGGQHGL